MVYDGTGSVEGGTGWDGRTNERTNKERQSYSADGPWTAEMSNID